MWLLLTLLSLVSPLVHGHNGSLMEEDPLGTLFTTDASRAADDHRIINPETAFTLEQLQAATPDIIHQLTPVAREATIDGEYRMQPVRVVHARAVSEMPVYDYIYDRFISSRGAEQGIKGFEAAMDGVTTASVEGVMHFLQTEVVNQFGRTVTTRCRRKNDIQYIVFYELLLVQANATLAEFQDNATLVPEYGPFVAFDHGRCTPARSPLGVDEFPDECYRFNGNAGRPALGPFVGAVAKHNETYAPYDHAYWFSFPHTCPTKTWAEKTPVCRASTRRGLCDAGVLPDGEHCVYTHRILGFVSLDDVSGITTLVNNATQRPFGSFSEFCSAGGVEFAALAEPGGFFFLNGLPFWQHPVDPTANARRVKRLIDTYHAFAGPNATAASASPSLSASSSSSSVHPRLRDKMRPLPTPLELAESNPPCYLHVPSCATAAHGCRRESYAQICRVCPAPLEGCVKAPPTFKFPALHKIQQSSSSALSSSSSASSVATWTDVGEQKTPQPSRDHSLALKTSSNDVVAVLLLLLLALWT